MILEGIKSKVLEKMIVIRKRLVKWYKKLQNVECVGLGSNL